MSIKSQHNPEYRRLTAFLRQMREKAGLTQQQLAGRLRVPQSYIYKSETAIRRVDITEFVAWAEACGQKPVNALQLYLNPPEPRQ